MSKRRALVYAKIDEHGVTGFETADGLNTVGKDMSGYVTEAELEAELENYAKKDKMPIIKGAGLDSAKMKTEDSTMTNNVAGAYSMAIGTRNQAPGKESLAAGGNSIAGRAESYPGADDGANDCFALGYRAEATGENSFVAGGYKAKAIGKQSFATGRETVASETNASAFGRSTTASGECSFSEGRSTTASGGYSHAEGNGASAISAYSHAEGHNTVAGVTGAASAIAAHAEGEDTVADADYTHAGGKSSGAHGAYAFAHGYGCQANHECASVFGLNNRSTAKDQTVIGRYSYGGGGTDTVSVYSLFAIGAGDPADPFSCFQAGYGNIDGSGTDKSFIELGQTVLTEDKLIALLALLQ